MLSTELLVQASLNFSSGRWHCDLEPLVFKESSLLTATVGRVEQRICPKEYVSYSKQQSTGQGAMGNLIAKEHTQLVGC